VIHTGTFIEYICPQIPMATYLHFLNYRYFLRILTLASTILCYNLCLAVK